MMMTVPAYIIDRWVLNPLHDIVLAFADEMPHETDFTSSLAGSWYLTPRQHGLEFILVNVLFFVLFMHSLRKVLSQGSVQRRMVQQLLPPRTAFSDKFLLIAFVAIFFIVLAHKYFKNCVIFMLQPCHVNVIIMVVLLMSDTRSMFTHILFNVYLCNVWGTSLALAVPDLRDYHLFFETEMYWIEHWALVLVPVYLAIIKRFVIFPVDKHVIAVAVLGKNIYHSLVLGGLALYTGQNLNYMLSPPPGIVQLFGPFYRLIMYAFAFFLGWVTRAVFLQGVFSTLDLLVPKKEMHTNGSKAD